MYVTIDSALAYGEDMLRMRNNEEARKAFNSILNKNPDVDKAVFGLGCIEIDNGNSGLAANLFRRAIDINPNNLTAMLNLAPCLRRCELLPRAREVHEIADELLTSELCAVEGDFKRRLRADNFGNWSGTYVNAGEPQKAEAIAAKGLQLDAAHPHASNHMALALLEQGRWSQAWPYWDRRVKRPGFCERTLGGVPYWDGKPTDCLVIHGEQGIGDEIMFASAVKDAVAVAKSVIIECEPRLIPLFERAFGVPCYPHEDAIMAKHKPTAKIPLGGLLSLFRPTPASCPGTPYLRARADLVEYYRGRLAALGPGRKIGIAWRGGTPQTHEHIRKVPLDKWGPILTVPDATFVSLQYGDGAALEADAHGVHHWPQAIKDLERQAGLIMAVDMVISVCQSVVHLAGALGRTTFVLTPNQPRWCYGLQGASMPFYASVRQFRQTATWDDPIHEIMEALKADAMREAA